MLSLLLPGEPTIVVVWLVGVVIYALATYEHAPAIVRPLVILSLWFITGSLLTVLGVLAALAITAGVVRQRSVILQGAIEAVFVLVPVAVVGYVAALPGIWQIVLLTLVGAVGYWGSQAALHQMQTPGALDVLLLAQVIPLAHMENTGLAALLLAGLGVLASWRARPGPTVQAQVPLDAVALVDYVDEMMQPGSITLVQPIDNQLYRVIHHQNGARTDQETDRLSAPLKQVLDGGTPTETPEYMIVPLLDKEQVVGTLRVDSTQERGFTRDQMASLQALMPTAAASLARDQRLRTYQQQIGTLTHLHRLSVDANSMTTKSITALHVIETAQKMFDAYQAALYHLDEEKEQVKLLVSPWQNAVHSQSNTLIPVKLEVSLALEVMREGQVRVIKQHKQDQTKTLLLAPLLRRPHVTEILMLVFEEERTFQSWQLDALKLLANQAASQLEAVALNEDTRAASNRMQAILSSIQDGIILLDRQKRLLDYNTAAERLLVLPLATYLYTAFDDLPHPYELVERSEAPFGMSRHIATPERTEWERVDGTKTTYIEQVWLPVQDAQDRMSGHVVVLRDITDQKHLIASRNETIFMLVHDLRSPLGSVIAGLRFANDLMTEPDGVDYLPEVLNVAYNSSRRLLRLINTLLDVEREQMQLVCDIYHLNEIIEEAYLELSQSANEARISITRHIANDLPYVYVDNDKIQRVLINLMDNAMDYSEHEVMVSAYATDKYVIVRVADDGPGVPADKRETVFEKFLQADNQQKRRGKHSGIGLAFCRRVIEAHGGTIKVVDGDDLPGACFEFTLPVYDDEQAST